MNTSIYFIIGFILEALAAVIFMPNAVGFVKIFKRKDADVRKVEPNTGIKPMPALFSLVVMLSSANGASIACVLREQSEWVIMDSVRMSILACSLIGGILGVSVLLLLVYGLKSITPLRIAVRRTKRPQLVGICLATLGFVLHCVGVYLLGAKDPSVDTYP
jgi:hypothetical protein